MNTLEMQLMERNVTYNPGIKESFFYRPSEVFHCFGADRR